jgi:hypothetical protein
MSLGKDEKTARANPAVVYGGRKRISVERIFLGSIVVEDQFLVLILVLDYLGSSSSRKNPSNRRPLPPQARRNHHHP